MTSNYYLEHEATHDEMEVIVEEQDFIQGIAELVPSVSQQDLMRYEVIRENFEGTQAKRNESEINTTLESSPERIMTKGKGKGKGKRK